MNRVLRFATASVAAALVAEAAGQCAPTDATCSATASTSLLQRRNSLDRSGYAPPQDPSLVSERARGDASGIDKLEESLVYPDFPDPRCQLGGACATAMIPQMRSVCVRNAQGSPECWDVCNTTHPVEAFTTGKPVIDIRIRAAVKDIRAGAYSYVKCPGNDNATSKSEQEVGVIPERNATAKNREAAEKERAEKKVEETVAKARVGTAEAEAIAAEANLDGEGFKEVVKTRNNDAMESFIRRVVRESLGCRVADEDKLEAYGMFYSVEKEATFRQLEAELYKACTTKSIGWLTPMFGGEGSPGSETKYDFEFNEDGYQDVASKKDHVMMSEYVRGLVKLLGGTVLDDAGLEGMTSYYSGEKASQSFSNLMNELRVIMSSPDGWVVGNAQTSMTQLGRSAAGGGFRRPQAAKNQTHYIDCPDNDTTAAHNSTAWALPTNESGYQALVNLKEHHDCAMTHFIRRLIDSMGCKIVDESGLRGMVPFFSGGKKQQSFRDLMAELKGACFTSARWLTPKNKTVALLSRPAKKIPAALLAEQPILERLEQLESELRLLEKNELRALEDRERTTN